jgi:hypothetical protein
VKAYWGSGGIAPRILWPRQLDGGEWSASRPCRFDAGERAPGTHWIEGWVGPKAVLDAMVKRKIPSPRRESNPRTPMVQPVAQRYTDRAITALTSSFLDTNILLSTCSRTPSIYVLPLISHPHKSRSKTTIIIPIIMKNSLSEEEGEDCLEVICANKESDEGVDRHSSSALPIISATFGLYFRPYS